MISFDENESCPVRLHNEGHCSSQFSAHFHRYEITRLTLWVNEEPLCV